jgi:glycosyltransferase involved in cell wall biosynthesis
MSDRHHARLAVCIPAYNQPGFLHEAMTSLCDQGLSRHEYVVVVSDDASPAPLRAVAASFEDRLQVVYHRNATNLGHIANYEKSWHLVEAPYISFLPHDDLIAPGQLGRALTAIEQEPPAVLVASLALCQSYPGAADTRLQGTFLRGAATANYAERYAWGQSEWMALALAATPLSIVGSVFRAETFARCQQWKSFPLWHDRLMLAEMGLLGSVVSLPWIGGYYRTGGWQLSGQLWKTDMKEFVEVSTVILRWCDAAGIPVIEFWVDQICQSQPQERVVYLQMLATALPRGVFDDIKHRSEMRLQTRLHLGGRLDRIGVPRPISSMLKGVERFLATLMSNR